MSLYDFIDEGFSIVYHNQEKEDERWGHKEKLKEEFPDKERVFSTFHKRMLVHFKLNVLYELREIERLAAEMYGYKKPVVTSLMRHLWLNERVRRFVKSREKAGKAQARGVHYVFLPKDMWGKRDMWGAMIPAGNEPSEQPE